MTGYERVRAALAGRPCDRVPRGEFALAPALAAALRGFPGGPDCDLPGGTDDDLPGGADGELVGRGRDGWAMQEAALRRLGADMVGVLAGGGGPGGSSWVDEIGYWAGRDLFVWAVVDGPWQGLAGAAGWSTALLLMTGAARHGDPAEAAPSPAVPADEAGLVQGLLLLQLDRVLAQLRQALAAGADGIVLGEDVAYGESLILSPRVIEERLLPLWREVVARCRAVRTARGEAPLVVFHSDGRVEPLVPAIHETGFSGIHSLEPEAGTDVPRLLASYRGRLGFLGGLSVDVLCRGTPEEARRQALHLARAARDGGLVVGTSSGVVPQGVQVANLLAAYRALDEVVPARS